MGAPRLAHLHVILYHILDNLRVPARETGSSGKAGKLSWGLAAAYSAGRMQAAPQCSYTSTVTLGKLCIHTGLKPPSSLPQTV